MKHKHYDMIVAKAANIALVKFVKLPNEWVATTTDEWNFTSDYFLCLPKHKDACLKWLNGSIMEQRLIGRDDLEWSEMLKSSLWKWDAQNNTMQSKYEFRIKPKKEKRWIAATKTNCIDKLFYEKSQAEEFVTAFYPNNNKSDFQFIEIEVEV